MIAMQSSGVGNCINALGLPAAMRAPCLMLVTMRGQWGEFNPWQVAMGQGTRPALEAVGVKCFPVDRAEEVGETFGAAADLAFNGGFACAVLVSQRIIGAKGFGQNERGSEGDGTTISTGASSWPPCSPGATARWSCPGSAARPGIASRPAARTTISTAGAAWASPCRRRSALAMARPGRRVCCLTGDGEMMMGLGSLAVVGGERPENLSVLVLDNEHFGETGRQPGLTRALDLAAMAAASGIGATMRVTRMDQVDELAAFLFRDPGPSFAVAKIALGEHELLLPEKDGAMIARRFRDAAAG